MTDVLAHLPLLKKYCATLVNHTTTTLRQHDTQGAAQTAEPWRKSNPNDPILFVLQPSDNWSMNDLDPIDWFNNVYKKIRPLTKRKFIVRPHPNHVAAMDNRKGEFPKDVEIIIGQKFFSGDEKKYYRFNFQDALNNCHAVITHNSTASVDSCVRGVPTFVTSDLAIAWPVANNDLLKIESPIHKKQLSLKDESIISFTSSLSQVSKNQITKGSTS